MLHRSITLSRSCRCTSTSTALPCIHANTPPSQSQHHFHSDRPSRKPTTTTTNVTKPNQDGQHRWFTPVRAGWNGWVAVDQSPQTVRDHYQDQDRHPPRIESRRRHYHHDGDQVIKSGSNHHHHHHHHLESYLSPSTDHSLKSISKKNNNLSSSPSIDTSTSNNDDDLETTLITRLTTYLSTRGPRTSLTLFTPSEYDQFLQIAERKNLWGLKAMVLEDLELREMSNRERGRFGMERFEGVKGKKKKDEREEVGEGKVFMKGLAEIVEPVVPQDLIQSKEGSQKKRTADQDIKADDVDASTEDRRKQIIEGLRRPETSKLSSLFPTTTSDPSSIPLLAWEEFERDADLEHSIEDYQTTLSFLHHLIKPSTTSSSPSSSDNSTLALKVFTSLVEVLPEDLVATSPTPFSPSDSTIPSEVSLRFIILRTLSHAATSEHLFSTSLDALESIDTLHRLHLEKVKVSTTEDVELGVQMLNELVEEMKGERKVSYQVWKNDSAKRTIEGGGGGMSKVEIGEGGLRLLKRWLALQNDNNRELSESSEMKVLPRAVRSIINSFVVDAAERYRWDVVARVWKEWKGEWEMEKYHLKLLRWLTGEAPYSTYASSEVSSENKTLSTRTVQTELFTEIAESTHRQLRQGKLVWTTQDKYEWIDLLTTSPAANRTTRSLARRIVRHWTSQHPLSSSNPFILRGPTLLNLVRTSLPPYSPCSTYHAPFVRTLLNDLIQAFVNPSSPYSTSISSSSSSSPHLLHFDLTTLAQAYTLLNDHDSVAQIYRKLLSQRQLPDAKDVEIVLGSAPKRHVESSIEFVRQAKRMGVKVGVETVEKVLRSVLEGEVEVRKLEEEDEREEMDINKKSKRKQSRAQLDERVQTKFDQIVNLAKVDLGFDQRQIERLERFYQDFLPLTPSNEIARYSSSRLSRLLDSQSTTLNSSIAFGLIDKAKKSRDSALAIRVYRHCVHPSSSTSSHPSQNTHSRPRISSSKLYQQTLSTLLHCLSYARTSTRPSIRATLQDFFDLTLVSDPSLISSSRETIESTLSGLIKCGEIDAVDKMWQVLTEEDGKESVEVGKEMKEKLVRWAVGLEGRETTSERDGIVGTWARDILNVEKS